MEHILLECDAPGRKQVWELANKLWRMRSDQPLPTTYGGILGCGLAMYAKENGRPDTGLNGLFRIIVSESAHPIWKLRCERRIEREDNVGRMSLQERETTAQLVREEWGFSGYCARAS